MNRKIAILFCLIMIVPGVAFGIYWTYDQNFDTLNLGPLIGQGGWKNWQEAVYSETQIVENDPQNPGNKFLHLKDKGVAYRDVSTTTDAAFYYMLKYDSLSNKDTAALEFTSGKNRVFATDIKISPDGFLSVYTDLAYKELYYVTPHEWHVIGFQYDGYNHRFKIRFDKHEWTDWFITGTEKDWRIRHLYIAQDGGGDSYIDDISEVDPYDFIGRSFFDIAANKTATALQAFINLFVPLK